MIKLIGIDLDGTLLNSKGMLSRENKIAIEECTKRRIIVSIVTGRGEISTFDIIKELNLLNNKHLVANGAVLLDYVNSHEVLFQIDDELYKECTKLLRKDNREFMALNKDGFYYEKKSPFYELIASWANYKGLVKGDLDSLKGVYRISVFAKDLEDVDHVKTFLPNTLYGTLDKEAFDVRPKGVNKGEGLEILRKKYNIKEDELAFIGDQAGDEEALKNYQFTFTPKSGEEVAKKAAKTILTKSNDEDCVAQMIYDYIL